MAKFKVTISGKRKREANGIKELDIFTIKKKQSREKQQKIFT